jgi:hypothetical protein
VLAAGALLVVAAALGWRHRPRRAKSTGVVSEPSFWAHLAATSGGPATDGDRTGPGRRRPTWAAVASEIRRRPRRAALIAAGAAVLVAAPAVFPLSPLLWLLLLIGLCLALIGLCLAAPFVWHAPARGPRREERRDPVAGQGREDGLLRSSVHIGWRDSRCVRPRVTNGASLPRGRSGTEHGGCAEGDLHGQVGPERGVGPRVVEPQRRKPGGGCTKPHDAYRGPRGGIPTHECPPTERRVGAAQPRARLCRAASGLCWQLERGRHTARHEDTGQTRRHQRRAAHPSEIHAPPS